MQLLKVCDDLLRGGATPYFVVAITPRFVIVGESPEGTVCRVTMADAMDMRRLWLDAHPEERVVAHV
jgi:hypothetical protein